MSKKYLVVSNLYGEEVAFVFDSHDEAVEYINKTTESLDGDNYIVAIEEVEDDYYRIAFNNNTGFTMAIKAFAATKIKFHLARYDDDEYTETRRFSTHEKAVTFVDKVFDKYDFDADEYEVEAGEWHLVDEGNDLNIKFVLFVVVLDEESGSIYHDILGVSSGATKKEIKAAYRKKSKEHHPDLSGDEQKFKKINEAYNELMNDEFKKKSNSVADIYPCANIKYILEGAFKRNQFEYDKNSEVFGALVAKTKKAAVRSVWVGIVFIVFGLILTAILHDAISKALPDGTSPGGGPFTIFWGITLLGVWELMKGAYGLAYPEDVTKKAIKKANKNKR